MDADCDICIANLAEYEIVLMNEQVFWVCETCVFTCIKENADTDNPVFTMTELMESVND